MTDYKDSRREGGRHKNYKWFADLRETFSQVSETQGWSEEKVCSWNSGEWNSMDAEAVQVPKHLNFTEDRKCEWDHLQEVHKECRMCKRLARSKESQSHTCEWRSTFGGLHKWKGVSKKVQIKFSGSRVFQISFPVKIIYFSVDHFPYKEACCRLVKPALPMSFATCF